MGSGQSSIKNYERKIALRDRLNYFKTANENEIKRAYEKDPKFFFNLFIEWKVENIVRDMYSDYRYYDSALDVFPKFFKLFLFKNEKCFYPALIDISVLLHTSTNYNAEFGKQIFESGNIEMIITEILSYKEFSKQEFFDTESATEPEEIIEQRHTVVRRCMGIMYNVIRLNEDLCPKIRKLGIINTIQNVLNIFKDLTSRGDNEIKITCNFSLAFLNIEKDDSLVNISYDSLSFLINYLKQSLESEDHKYYGFSVDEIIVALNKLSISDENKKKMKEHIPLFFKALKDANSNLEEKSVIDCLWTLSFDEENRKIIESEYLEIIKKIRLSGKSNESKEGAKKLIFELEKSKRIKEREKYTIDKNNGHIMISYNWKQKPIARKIRDHL